jgi:hypothetical protein
MLKQLLAMAACAALALGAADAQAMRLPELSLAAGSTTLVNGDPGGGGLAASMSAMWAADSPWTFGLTVFADDMGTDLAHYRDVHDGSDLGAYEAAHRFAYGAAWRVDAALPERGRWEPFASATWGAYRIQDDARGVQLAGFSSTGLSVGAGIRHPALATGAVGLTARWHRLQRGPSNGWLSTELDWQWRWGRRP